MQNSQKISLYLTSSLLLSLCLQNQCAALEPGFYEQSKNPTEMGQISHAMETANRTLYCYGTDEFFLKPSDKPLTAAQVESTLLSEKKKSMLLISLENDRKRDPFKQGPLTTKQLKEKQEKVQRLMPMIEKLKYKRVLMISPPLRNVRGMYVLKDLESGHPAAL